MFERLFGSTSRSKILKFFCEHETGQYYMRELARLLDIKLNALSRELENLEELGFIRSMVEQNKKYYAADLRFPLRNELCSMVEKSILLLERELIAALAVLDQVQVALLTGLFIGQTADTDVLVVGSIDRAKVQRLIARLSQSFFQDIRFTVLTPREFSQRIELNDKFVHQIISASPIIAVDRRTA